MRPAYIFILTLCITACGHEITISDYIDSTRPISILSRREDVTKISNTTSTIEPGSKKYEGLLEWAEKNRTDWNSTPATYFVVSALSQDDFHLIYNRDGYVVVSFLDKSNKPHQYSKTIAPGELDFLFE